MSHKSIEILSPHEICITYRHGVSLGQVARELMAIESWGDLPILVTMVIIKRSKVDAIVKARQKYRKEQKDRELRDLEMLKQGQGQVAAQKEVLKWKMLDHDVKHGHPPMDIQQNLRGPETSAAGPFREGDSSRPIQCFRYRGWGHPKRLCPSHLNYTPGGVVQDNPSQMTDRRPDGPPPQNPSPQQ